MWTGQREAERRYHNSAKGKAVQDRYRRSAKGRAGIARRNHRYRLRHRLLRDNPNISPAELGVLLDQAYPRVPRLRAIWKPAEAPKPPKAVKLPKASTPVPTLEKPRVADYVYEYVPPYLRLDEEAAATPARLGFPKRLPCLRCGRLRRARTPSDRMCRHCRLMNANVDPLASRAGVPDAA